VPRIFFYVLLTVHLSIFISVINQIDAKNFCFTISLFHASTCFEHMCSSSGGQNLHYTASGIITLKQVSGLKSLKYNSINMCEFFGCDYCVLLTINTLCHVEVTFIQLLHLLERYSSFET